MAPLRLTTRIALRSLRVLEGTLIKDIRALAQCARTFDIRPRSASDLGALNFSLMLVCLVGCETLGSYTSGARQHSRNRPPSHCDPGVYLMDFLRDFFPARSYFKKLCKVLADELRHDLVHGFGSKRHGSQVRLALYVDPNTASQIKVGAQRGHRLLALNAVAFAEQTAEAFERLRRAVADESDPELVKRIARAARLAWPPTQGVRQQFDQVYHSALGRGLTFSVVRRARPPSTTGS